MRKYGTWKQISFIYRDSTYLLTYQKWNGTYAQTLNFWSFDKLSICVKGKIFFISLIQDFSQLRESLIFISLKITERTNQFNKLLLKLQIILDILCTFCMGHKHIQRVARISLNAGHHSSYSPTVPQQFVPTFKRPLPEGSRVNFSLFFLNNIVCIPPVVFAFTLNDRGHQTLFACGHLWGTIFGNFVHGT